MLNNFLMIGFLSIVIGYGLGLMSRYIRQVFYTVFSGILFVGLFFVPNFSFNVIVPFLQFDLHFVFDAMSYFFFILIKSAISWPL